MSLYAAPSSLEVPTAGGSVFFTLSSTFENRSAFKVKISNLELYRVKPVYGFLDPKGSIQVEVLRLMGPGKEEKLVVQWAEVPPEEQDAAASFKAGAESGEATIALKPK